MMGKERGIVSALLITNLNVNKSPKITDFHVHSFLFFSCSFFKKKLMTLFLSNKGKVEGSIYLVS